ncbi:MAG: signal peptide peptidase SppA [Clostridiales Family XIII bacterium]|jgi:protease-4|nr:signal peptide peptidase SppA [Clostridiales Family XIII bacterium]
MDGTNNERDIAAATDSAAAPRFRRDGQRQPMNKKTLRDGLIIYLLIIGVIFALVVFLKYFLFPGMPDEYIAKLTVSGTIDAEENEDIFGSSAPYQHSWTLNKIAELEDDPKNKGLILFVNTPGGGVYESDELYLKIKEYKKKTGNPVYVAMGSMAASGGYYISAPADKIYANRNTWTGSIGVMMGTVVDVSEFLEKYGVRAETFASGRNKGMGGYFDPLTDEQRAIFQGLADEAYEQFVDIVAAERDLSVETVKNIADGRVYTAKQALKLGLIDEIGAFDEALRDMRMSYGLDCPLVDIYRADSSFFGRLLGFKATGSLVSALENFGKGDVSAVLDFAQNRRVAPVRYQYQ